MRQPGIRCRGLAAVNSRAFVIRFYLWHYCEVCWSSDFCASADFAKPVDWIDVIVLFTMKQVFHIVSRRLVKMRIDAFAHQSIYLAFFSCHDAHDVGHHATRGDDVVGILWRIGDSVGLSLSTTGASNEGEKEKYNRQDSDRRPRTRRLKRMRRTGVLGWPYAALVAACAFGVLVRLGSSELNES